LAKDCVNAECKSYTGSDDRGDGDTVWVWRA
jgi:hypothetical protein